MAEFGKGRLMQTIHGAMIKRHYGDKLAGHISRDSTAIEAREKPTKKKARPHLPNGHAHPLAEAVFVLCDNERQRMHKTNTA